MTTPSSNPDHDERFPIVGRDGRVDLTKYTVQIHGHEIIDYEKLKAEDPALYKEIVAGELKANHRERQELDEILAAPAIQLTPALLTSLQTIVAPDKPATSKYFYLPLFLSIPQQPNAVHKAGSSDADLLSMIDV
jgi:hypothetical protein